MAGDPSFNSVSLLLHCEGADASTIFTDNSPSPLTVTANGNAQIDTAQAKFGSASGLFDGTGDYLTFSSTTGFAFGTGDFTVEFWVRFSSIASPNLMDFRPDGSNTGANPVLYYDSGALRYYVPTSDRIIGGALSTVTWYHIALCRKSGTTRLFINGTQSGSSYVDSNNYTASKPRFGANLNATDGLVGWFDDIRVTKGVGRYTGTFSPPLVTFPNVLGSAAASTLYAYRRRRA